MSGNGRQRARFVLAVVCAHNAVTPARRRRPKRIKATNRPLVIITSDNEKELREIASDRALHEFHNSHGASRRITISLREKAVEIAPEK